MTDCKHPHLTLLESPIHASGKDYHCDSCGEQFRVRELTITVEFGMPVNLDAAIERMLYAVDHPLQPLQLEDVSSVTNADIKTVCDAASRAAAPDTPSEGTQK